MAQCALGAYPLGRGVGGVECPSFFVGEIEGSSFVKRGLNVRASESFYTSRYASRVSSLLATLASSLGLHFVKRANHSMLVCMLVWLVVEKAKRKLV